MAYRSDKDARDARRVALERELQEIRDALDPLEARAEILEEDLDHLREPNQAPRRSMLDGATVANPCPKSWADMKGDDKVRFCGGCKKNVYNIIAMTRVEAEDLLSSGDVCARLFRRPDGTVMTSDCAPGRWRRRGQKAVALAAAASLSATAVYAASKMAAAPAADKPVIEHPVMGAIAAPVPPQPPQPIVEPPIEPLMGEIAVPPPVEKMGKIRAPIGQYTEVMGRMPLPKRGK